ncbi:hypothetical protein SISSUDRAFT_697087 [Sistotremastrum suecicum HHB10207 ss-3]|uniref:Uncharacterized protein n=1 Tax=Sistotremastrum suecicum HHB10207 ss-3 TaxID=1314776 RepID=A0A166DXC7_9AGAM|nr:hypothetical protein SISSUDRAFT_697087 [Sistotremastrum suecicum HHB10207 ss-3]
MLSLSRFIQCLQLILSARLCHKLSCIKMPIDIDELAHGIRDIIDHQPSRAASMVAAPGSIHSKAFQCFHAVRHLRWFGD